MKFIKISLLVLILSVFSCSPDDESNTLENGINKSFNLKTTGSSANDFLSASKYSSLVIEILYVQNFRPNAQTLTNLKSFMEQRLNKPGGITIIETQIASPGGSPYTIDEIAKIETDNRTKYNNTGVLALYGLFLDGSFTDDTSNSFTLGIAYRNTSFVLFENSIRNLSDNINEPNRVDLETTVILHELCHLLGLVSLGSPMQTEHIDEAHGKHCDNQNCLMFWQTENSSVLQMMSTGNVPQLDANCLADLKANGGK